MFPPPGFKQVVLTPGEYERLERQLNQLQTPLPAAVTLNVEADGAHILTYPIGFDQALQKGMGKLHIIVRGLGEE